MKKLRVGIVFGGKSAEHEVSLQSAKNVIDAIDRDKYEVVLIGIDKTGRWQLSQASEYLLNANNPKLVKLNHSNDELAIAPGKKDNPLMSLSATDNPSGVDVIFPVLHGPYGEDGTIQGLLKLIGVPFVGAGVLGSAVGMDKDVMKRLLREAGFPIPKFMSVLEGQAVSFDSVREKLGSPVFVKPANLGSSVGVSRAENEASFNQALSLALCFDRKAVLEEAIVGREIEVAVLGNEAPKASVPGEIIPKSGYYSYESKYIDEDGAGLAVPADIPEEKALEIRNLAIGVFQTLCCEGMARVDFFLTPENKVIVNELNSIPGFTKISMYPRLWEASGVKYSELIDRLIQLAVERSDKEKKLKVSYD